MGRQLDERLVFLATCHHIYFVIIMNFSFLANKLMMMMQRTVYSYKWLPINCRSGADQGKSAGQRPTFCH